MRGERDKDLGGREGVSERMVRPMDWQPEAPGELTQRRCSEALPPFDCQ